MALSEADTRTKLIDPALHYRGWMEDLIRREATAGTVEIVDSQPHKRSRGRETCLTYKANAFPQMLLLVAFAHAAAKKIYQAIVTSTEGARTLLPILHPHNTIASSRRVDFDLARDVYRTRPDKLHVSQVVSDSGWDAKNTIRTFVKEGKQPQAPLFRRSAWIPS